MNSRLPAAEALPFLHFLPLSASARHGESAILPFACLHKFMMQYIVYGVLHRSEFRDLHKILVYSKVSLLVQKLHILLVYGMSCSV